MASQIVGYKYFTNFLLFIGNPIEKMLGINFDKRGWLKPFVGENGNASVQGVIDSPNLYGENEGGVAGVVYARYGTDNQDVLPFYKEYMESKELQASAYPYQSYLAFKDFYVGNTGYMKEMLLWPKRIRVRNDGREQWYGDKSEIIDMTLIEGGIPITAFASTLDVSCEGFSNSHFEDWDDWKSEYAHVKPANGVGLDQNGGWFGEFRWNDSNIGETVVTCRVNFSVYALHKVQIEFITSDSFDLPPYVPFHFFSGEVLSVDYSNTGGGINRHYYIVEFVGESLDCTFSIDAHISKTDPSGVMVGYNNSVGSVSIDAYYPKPFKEVEIIGTDINPIHKIREVLTDDTAMKKPESSVNNENFIKAADRIYDEALGISWSITEKSCVDAINELCYHIEAGIRVNRQTGLYEVILFRDDWFEEDEIHSISESKIKSMQYEITNADEVINQVNVNFYDRTNIKNSSFSISENGLIQTLGRVNAETLDFPYFMNMRNAEIVANWKLKLLSTGVYKGTFTTGWREARKWNRYDLIRLPWSKRWNGTILVRIMSINLGSSTNNEVSIDFIEVVPSTGMMNTTIVADDSIDKPLPPQSCQYEPFEMPYYLAVMALGQRQIDDELAYESNFGLVGVVAEQPQSNSLYAVMMTNNYDEWIRAGSIQYSETANLDQNISKVSTSFTVKNWKKIANFPVGTLIQCGKEWLTGFVEWMVFQGVDPYTGIVSVKRGALDTQPQDWDLGLKLYFCGTDIAYDATEYVAGEKVLVSALTTTPSGVLELKGSHSVEMKARAIRPYPPANVKINSFYYPETLLISNDIVLTWVDRNRLQQTGGEILGFYEAGVTAENGVTYSYELVCENVVVDSQSNISANTVTILKSKLLPNKPHTLRLWSVRDGYDSYQTFEHSFFVESVSLILVATVSKDKVIGSTLPASNITADIDELLGANMRWDGTSIKGKAQAGSTVTIEVQE